MSQTMTSERGQRTDSKTYKNYIGGRWVESKSGRTFTSTNPAHKDEVLGVMQASTGEDVNAAIEAAQKAFPGWRHTPAPTRGEICLKAGLIVQERKEELARLMTQEMGKVLKEARGDVQEAIDMAKYAAGLGRHPHGETVPSELRNKWCMTERVPLGVVACITPWNFPMAIPSWKIFPAVMAGNAVVFKPASDTPIIATKLVEIFEEAGLPGGVLNLVTGSGSDVGDVLVRDPRVQGISFTGSTAAGKHIAEIAGRNLKRLGLELGGKNAIVVLDDADLPLAVDGALWAAFGTSGQRCTAASRLIVDKKIENRENHLKTMRQHMRHAAPPAIFHVVMNRMIVAAGGLEGGEQRVRHGPARQHEALAEREILKPAVVEAAVPRRVERLGHWPTPEARKAPLIACCMR